MARNFKELQAGMDPGARADNRQRVRDELQRMALDELRSAKQLTQADMAEMLDVPQSSISRIERRADMYLSTLRNYIHAMGGVLQIQAVFPDGGPVVIDRFGDYENATYMVWARSEGKGSYRLLARPFQHSGETLSTKSLKASAFIKSMAALHLTETQISEVRKTLQNAGELQIGNGSGPVRFFSAPDLIAAGFDAAGMGQFSDL
ncbi:MAG TPA: XRE family transcriptional regulator [Bryobacteraceae bacterium]|jgi:DNA-binding XRE family transcriptional regulator|nr:XRE family transcriptional regulator [Bryobacteraceae bacterium]